MYITEPLKKRVNNIHSDCPVIVGLLPRNRGWEISTHLLLYL